MQVVDEQDRRLAPAAGVHEPPGQLEELPLAGLRIHAGHRPLGIRNAEEVEQQGQRVGQRRIEQEERAGNLPAGRLVAVLLRDAEVATHQLEDREERDHLPVRDAVGVVHRDALRAGALGELVAEPALPDPGLGDHADDLPGPRDGPPERCLEARHLLCPADEAGEAARPGDVETRAQRADALELVHAERRPHALDRRLSQVAQREEAGDEPGRVLGQKYLAGLRELLHALR